MKRVSWINLILGIWLIIAPFVFGFMGPRVTVVNDVVLASVDTQNRPLMDT